MTDEQKNKIRDLARANNLRALLRDDLRKELRIPEAQLEHILRDKDKQGVAGLKYIYDLVFKDTSEATRRNIFSTQPSDESSGAWQMMNPGSQPPAAAKWNNTSMQKSKSNTPQSVNGTNTGRSTNVPNALPAYNNNKSAQSTNTGYSPGQSSPEPSPQQAKQQQGGPSPQQVSSSSSSPQSQQSQPAQENTTTKTFASTTATATTAAFSSIQELLINQKIHLSNYSPGTYRIKCPKCHGGTSDEASFSITIEPDSRSALWHCFRATCGYAGSTHVDRPSVTNEAGYFVSSHRKRKEEPPVRPHVALESLTEEMMEFFENRKISAATLQRNRVGSQVVYDPGKKKEDRVIAFPYFR